jgi:hypothetical protein
MSRPSRVGPCRRPCQPEPRDEASAPAAPRARTRRSRSAYRSPRWRRLPSRSAVADAGSWLSGRTRRQHDSEGNGRPSTTVQCDVRGTGRTVEERHCRRTTSARLARSVHLQPVLVIDRRGVRRGAPPGPVPVDDPPRCTCRCRRRDVLVGRGLLGVGEDQAAEREWRTVDSGAACEVEQRRLRVLRHEGVRQPVGGPGPTDVVEVVECVAAPTAGTVGRESPARLRTDLTGEGHVLSTEVDVFGLGRPAGGDHFVRWSEVHPLDLLEVAAIATGGLLGVRRGSERDGTAGDDRGRGRGGEEPSSS